ncbi:hypothetical protein GUJ93_ZPchr0013g34796 [Zizania palustris]|uniref:Uncharacterized protein n=1 Tax=Zizania palustris TaxID=103762 RepID=A0A8J5X3A8_ZIZPA|nr:hypothetical protein GUJ93_ZPchr0013g34796 [Zizania palustris]
MRQVPSSNLSQPPAHNNLVSDNPCSMSMGSGDGMKEMIKKLAAKIDDLKTSLDKLAPLAPVAEQLATLPSKVVALQSSAFENQEQVRALNLTLLHVENAQREGKAHAEDNGDTTGNGSINQSRQGPVPPPENDRPPPRDRCGPPPPGNPGRRHNACPRLRTAHDPGVFGSNGQPRGAVVGPYLRGHPHGQEHNYRPDGGFGRISGARNGQELSPIIHTASPPFDTRRTRSTSGRWPMLQL